MLNFLKKFSFHFIDKILLHEILLFKLKENFKWYSDKLIIPAVYDTFKQTILKNARKLPQLKNETKMLIDELEKQIEEVKQKGVGEEGAATQAGEVNNVDMESQDDHDEENEQAVNRLTKTTRQQQQAQKNAAASRRGAAAETAAVNTSKSKAKSKNAKTKSSSLAAKFAKKGKKIDSSASSSSSNNETTSDDNSSDSD